MDRLVVSECSLIVHGGNTVQDFGFYLLLDGWLAW